jgi:hypothetical protein
MAAAASTVGETTGGRLPNDSGSDDERCRRPNRPGGIGYNSHYVYKPVVPRVRYLDLSE